MPQLILASESPFRKALLTDLGYEFSTQKPMLDERSLEEQFSGSIQEVAQYLSVKKAEKIFKDNPNSIIIGSDQVLIFENKTFPKPSNLEEVIHRLLDMQGKTHELRTGLCLMKKDEVFETTVVAKMTMKNLSEEEIRKYAELDQPIGCAGGYKIEENGKDLFENIETDDFNSIIGLPTVALETKLNQWGL